MPSDTVEAGFVPNDWQVGQNGQIVASAMYVPVGISGAIQYLIRIKDCRPSWCFNKDLEALIYR